MERNPRCPSYALLTLLDGAPACFGLTPEATLIGCAPNNFVAANAGAHLGELQSLADLASPRLMGIMALLGIAGVAQRPWRPICSVTHSADMAGMALPQHCVCRMVFMVL